MSPIESQNGINPSELHKKSLLWKLFNIKYFKDTYGVSPLSSEAQERVFEKIGRLTEITKEGESYIRTKALIRYVNALELAEGFNFDILPSKPDDAKDTTS